MNVVRFKGFIIQARDAAAKASQVSLKNPKKSAPTPTRPTPSHATNHNPTNQPRGKNESGGKKDFINICVLGREFCGIW